MPMATTAMTMVEDMVETPVVATALATTAAKKGKLLTSMCLLHCTDDNVATARPSVRSLARWARASTAAKKGESLLSALYFNLLIDFKNSHSKSECPKPRVFKGTCRICEKEGHPAVDCPERPPDVCKNCQAEGHKTMECKENRKFDLNRVADMLPHEGWAAMKNASDERDLDDFREVPGIHMYLESFELLLT